jgi:hypothetical protein
MLYQCPIWGLHTEPGPLGYGGKAFCREGFARLRTALRDDFKIGSHMLPSLIDNILTLGLYFFAHEETSEA